MKVYIYDKRLTKRQKSIQFTFKVEIEINRGDGYASLGEVNIKSIWLVVPIINYIEKFYEDDVSRYNMVNGLKPAVKEFSDVIKNGDVIKNPSDVDIVVSTGVTAVRFTIYDL